MTSKSLDMRIGSLPEVLSQCDDFWPLDLDQVQSCEMWDQFVSRAAAEGWDPLEWIAVAHSAFDDCSVEAHETIFTPCLFPFFSMESDLFAGARRALSVWASGPKARLVEVLGFAHHAHALKTRLELSGLAAVGVAAWKRNADSVQAALLLAELPTL